MALLCYSIQWLSRAMRRNDCDTPRMRRPWLVRFHGSVMDAVRTLYAYVEPAAESAFHQPRYNLSGRGGHLRASRQQRLIHRNAAAGEVARSHMS
jgi:hypothetical protein